MGRVERGEGLREEGGEEATHPKRWVAAREIFLRPSLTKPPILCQGNKKCGLRLSPHDTRRPSNASDRARLTKKSSQHRHKCFARTARLWQNQRKS
ncbi:unnamed protein product [Prunus brigantina]